jgi:hypothetical protein
MDERRVSGGDGAHRSTWRQDRDGAVGSAWVPLYIPSGSPAQQGRLPEEPCLIAIDYKDAVGECANIILIGLPDSWSRQTIAVQLNIHPISGRQIPGNVAMGGEPAAAELIILLMAALCAGPVSGRKRGRLV